ncbi:hypothetical protein JTB14_005477 [Gonioctena quinquepunctata]|nr:hypothetical protein JTB14_005477 [Gonioctena quinquepunctata]
MKHEDLFVQGTELSEFKYDNFWDWFVHISDVRIHWENQPTYIISQFAYLVGALATLIHAFARGGRLPFLWLAIMIHGVIVESISYVHPDVDNFWHSQTSIIFLGRRLPLHIILLYPCFIYQGTIAVAKMRLPKWSEPFAVGLLVVLIDIPYDIVSVKFLHWTWHDTDPNIVDRHYWVPWNSYYFHAAFTAGFTFWFHFTREKLCSSKEKWAADKSVAKELFCSLIAGILGAPTGILAFVTIYHPLHDIYNIHSEVAFFIIFAVFLLLIWTGDRQRTIEPTTGIHRIHWSTWMMTGHLVLHYGTFTSPCSSIQKMKFLQV